MFELTIKKTDLERILPLVIPLKTNTMPVLTCIHFIVTNRTADIAATSLDWTKRHILPATITKYQAEPQKVTFEGKTRVVIPKEIAISVPFDRFKKLLGLLPKGDAVTLSWDKYILSLIYKTGKLTMPTLDTTEIRELLDMPVGGNLAVIPTDDFKTLINSVKYALSKDETKYNLQNVQIITSPRTSTLRSAATDGHRMALHTIKSSSNLPDGILFDGTLISSLPGFTGKEIVISRWQKIEKKDVKQLLKTASPAGAPAKYRTIKKDVVTQERLVFRSGDYSIWQSHGNNSNKGTFPEIDRVIPPDSQTTTKFKIDPVKLDPVNKRAMGIGSGKFKGMCLALDKAKGLNISASDPNEGLAMDEDVPCQFLAQAQPVTFRLNANYLADVLAQAKGPMTFQVADELKPLKITCGNDTAIIMPMRL
jgi:DNA polymerase III sliding clamp (beta) subunit (PCNA family)